MATISDECFILIKAQPHRSSKYFETVCCAGVGRDRKWRRQYPVPFRILDEAQKFKRWQWIRYQYVKSQDDRRRESQKVIPESLQALGEVRKAERSSFLEPLVKASFADADSSGDSLTLIRPNSFSLEPLIKTQSEIADEARKHAELANQLSMFDATAKPLRPCALRFIARWRDQDGKSRAHECDDWETSAAFNRFEASYGREKAIISLQSKYDDYMKAGMVLGFSTHKRRNAEFGATNQWLLVGLIRLNDFPQPSLNL